MRRIPNGGFNINTIQPEIVIAKEVVEEVINEAVDLDDPYWEEMDIDLEENVEEQPNELV